MSIVCRVLPHLRTGGLALILGCGGSTAPAPAMPAASDRPVGAPTVATAAPAGMCDAVDAIVAAADLYDFPTIVGSTLSDDPPMSTVRVALPGATECTLGIDDVASTGEVWCVLPVPAERAEAEAHLAAVDAELAPCLPTDRWQHTTTDAATAARSFGWRYDLSDDDAVHAELRLEPSSAGPDTLIFRVVSARQ